MSKANQWDPLRGGLVGGYMACGGPSGVVDESGMAKVRAGEGAAFYEDRVCFRRII